MYLTSRGPAEYSCDGSFNSSFASCKIRFTATRKIYMSNHSSHRQAKPTGVVLVVGRTSGHGSSLLSGQSQVGVSLVGAALYSACDG